jgi:hypothetical protein
MYRCQRDGSSTGQRDAFVGRAEQHVEFDAGINQGVRIKCSQFAEITRH